MKQRHCSLISVNGQIFDLAMELPYIVEEGSVPASLRRTYRSGLGILTGIDSINLSRRRPVMFERMEDLTERKQKSTKEKIVECSLICMTIAAVLGMMVLALIYL
jgi:hypothetical protein